MTTNASCELCTQDGGDVVVREENYRIVLVNDRFYAGFCRVIWNDHVKEMTDLPSAERGVLMDAVWRVESAVREVMQPEKVNLACLGNQVPHLHWHVIPRYVDDAHFPNPIWSRARQRPTAMTLASRAALLPALREAILKAFGKAG